MLRTHQGVDLGRSVDVRLAVGAGVSDSDTQGRSGEDAGNAEAHPLADVKALALADAVDEVGGGQDEGGGLSGLE